MVRPLGQAGISISDTYDVKGSQAPIENIQSSDVILAHDMASTIFSERFSGTIRRVATAAIAQNITFDIVTDDLPDFITRVMGVAVIVNADRILNCAISVRDELSGRDHPIWVWDSVVDEVVNVRMDDSGSGPINQIYLRPIRTQPSPLSMVWGDSQPQRVNHIAFRGITSAFGAGTVVAAARYLIGFSEVGGLSSKGSPVPSW